jgi:hypothetical protein
MPKQVIKYQCNFCIRSWVSKKRAETHEAKCFRNPAVKSCFTCIYAIDGTSDSEPWCGILEKEIYVRGKPVYGCPRWRSVNDIDDSGEDDF